MMEGRQEVLGDMRLSWSQFLRENQLSGEGWICIGDGVGV
jgi:hypothetical protein